MTAKEILAQGAGILLCLAAGTLLGVVGTDAWLNHAENEKESAAIESLARAGRALLAAEAELGYLPKENWMETASAFDPNISDPGNSWGINLRTGLAQGSPARIDKDKQSSKDLPPDTILLMPSASPTFSPNRDGTLPNNDSDARKEFRRRSPHFTADGKILLLTEEESKGLLAIRPTPRSVAAQEAAASETRAIREEWEKNQAGLDIYPGYITLKSNKVETPEIPLGSGQPEISFEVFASEPTPITTKLIFLNENKQEINYDTDQQTFNIESHVDLVSKSKESYTKDLVPKGEKTLFNAEKGHADTNPEANYKKGVSVATGIDFKEMEVQTADSSWKKITVSPKKSVPSTAYIKVAIESDTTGQKEVIIRKIKASYRRESEL